MADPLTLIDYIAPLVGFLSIAFAGGIALQINKHEIGTEKMTEIYNAIRTGSKAYLYRQYKTISIIAIVLAIVLFIAFDNPRDGIPKISFSFLVGAAFSLLAGYVGMDVATRANARTATAGKHGTQLPLDIAYRGGLVMGLFNVGLSLIAVSALFYLYGQEISLIVGLAFGSSLAALFAQLGGGIFTKAADVGADLVGKVEAGIPEDDPRNPAVIADNVGDNVGDVAGRGADLFESITAENIAAMIVGVAIASILDNSAFVILPLLACALGLIATVVGLPFVRSKNFTDPMIPMRNGMIVTTILVIIGLYFLITQTVQSINLFYASLVGVFSSLLIFVITLYYTASKYRPVNTISEASESGPGVNIITGFSVALESTVLPILVIIFALGGGFYFGELFALEHAGKISPQLGGIYGTAVATMGMLSVAGVILSMDGFGPIVDNAGGMAEMSGADKSLRDRIDLFDAAGNTTKALTKGYALSSAGLAALILFQAYLIDLTHLSQEFGLIEIVSVESIIINLIDYKIIIALFIGGLLPYAFASFAIRAVGKTAFEVVAEVRRQFKEKPGILKGTESPDYGKAIDISTIAAQKEMIIPGLLPVVVPLIVGVVLGPFAVGAFLLSATVSGTLLAFMMNTGGAAWDNAKKNIETGKFGGKGSDAHKAAVVGDTLGDPFKDTAGPALHVLVKLINTISLTFIPLFLMFA
jgi:K(+)-stimulated pyrophosphate-energized sodium pump